MLSLGLLLLVRGTYHHLITWFVVTGQGDISQSYRLVCCCRSGGISPSYRLVCCYRSGGQITILPLGLLLQVRGRSYHRVCCYKSGGHITILSLGLLLQVRGRSYHRVCCYRSGGSLHRIVTQFRTGSQSLQLWKRQPTCRLDQTVL